MGTSKTSTHIRQFHDCDMVEVAMLTLYYNEMVNAGIKEDSFHDGCADTFMKFLETVNRTHFYIMYEGSRPMMHFFLNRFEGQTLHLHFGVLPEFQNKCLRIGHLTIQFIKDNYPELKAIMGITPTHLTEACRLAKALRFKELGTIPSCGFDYYRNEHYDGMLSILEV